MGGHKITDQTGYHFCTFTVVNWADIFTRQNYRDLVVDSFNHCINKKGLQVHAYVFMSNHIHAILSAKRGNLSDILRDLRAFTAKRIYQNVVLGIESRRHWLLSIFHQAAAGHARNEHFQVWDHDFHPVYVFSRDWMLQKLRYTHNNPVKAGLVRKPEDWIYSSAADYKAGRQVGPVNVTLLEWEWL